MELLPTEQGVGASAGLRPRAAGPPFSWERTSAPAWLSEVEQGGSNAGTQGCPERAQAPQSAFAIQCSRNHPGAEARSKPEPGPALGTGRVSLLMTRGAYEVRDLKRPTDSSDPPPQCVPALIFLLSQARGRGTALGGSQVEGRPRAPQGHAPALACVREGHLRPGLVENEEASPGTAAGEGELQPPQRDRWGRGPCSERLS